MSQTTDEIMAAAMALSPEERARLADSLLESLSTPEQREIDQSWAEEAERRIEEYEAGGITTIPADKVLRPRTAQPKP
jgi:putative addiction module component (TIGR02574 family)